MLPYKNGLQIKGQIVTHETVLVTQETTLYTSELIYYTISIKVLILYGKILINIFVGNVKTQNTNNK